MELPFLSHVRLPPAPAQPGGSAPADRRCTASGPLAQPACAAIQFPIVVFTSFIKTDMRRIQNTKTHVHKITNVTVFYMALELNDFDAGKSINSYLNILFYNSNRG
jgi:hypothetical protein